MRIALRRHSPLIVTLATLFAAIGALLVLSIHQNDGHLIYALDDAYIHMAIAKNFAQSGVWGVTSEGFSSSSSSLLWTLLLGLIYRLLGVNEYAPFVVNLLLSSALIVVASRLLDSFRFSRLAKTLVLLATVVFTPLPILVFIGLEHILHTLVTVAFVYLAAMRLTKPGTPSPSRRDIPLLLMAPALTGARYEGLFLLFIVCLLFFVRRRPLHALSIGTLGVAPVAVYGLVSMSQGWYFLPNSVLLKGNSPDLSSLTGLLHLFGYGAYRQMLVTPHILLLFHGALLVIFLQISKHRTLWNESLIAALLFAATCLLHMQFAATGWYFRYEAYLVFLGIITLSTSLADVVSGIGPIRFDARALRKHLVMAILISSAAPIFLVRGILSLVIIVPGTANIYQQQYQMGLFLKEFYQGAPVAANDIGAINFLADIRCLDLWGLANLEVARARREGTYNLDVIRAVAASEQTRIAIVYTEWFDNPEIGGIPPEWSQVGEWRISNRIVAGGDTVTFYAVDPAARDDLIASLQAFSDRLPREVIQEGAYTVALYRE